MNNRAGRDKQLKVIIQCNAHLKTNEVRDDCNIETSKNRYLHYLNYQRSFVLSLLPVYYTVNNWAWRDTQLNVIIHLYNQIQFGLMKT